MATTTTTTTDADAEQRKAEIKSNILFYQYGIVDEFKQQQWRQRLILKTMPDGTKQWVRKPAGNRTIDQPTDE
jgi:hypothetical protein